jgi:flagellar secretion chaperone FliS
MNPQAAQSYLKGKVLTATAEQLQLMLFDGAIRFAEQGKAALEKKDFETGHKCLSRAQQVVNELTATLRHDIYPELCGKLASLYNYAYRNLVQANIRHQPSLVDEALKVLRYQRETWAMLLDQLVKAKATEATKEMSDRPEDLPTETTISMQG